MTMSVSAVFENGVLRPIEPIGLTEGAHVEVIIVGDNIAASGKSAADTLLEIAGLPIQGGGDEHTARDHDQVLYSGKSRT